MRISPINNSINRTNFKGIKSATAGVSKEILGKKEAVLDVLSDEKEIDIWTFKRTKGGMVNPSTGYIILVQNQKNGEVLKEIEGPAEKLDELNERLENTLVWYGASDNYRIAHTLKQTQAYAENKEAGDEIANKLTKVGMSNEANTWIQRFNLI